MIFNRYWISDRSGYGVDKWKYFEGDFFGDKEEAWEHVIYSKEIWASHAGSYNFDIELNVVPPRQVVNKLITKVARQVVEQQEYLNKLLDFEQGLK